eukprot:CAMPEP_0183591830 /NCGR_PEP_ID=MMETSP0371-20130417/166975_1 /TAXON_ID=268820 /ORGANISM="Peridinium aciculiferum, Strain PAER-2" /LENGTH=82 /DNA_ID=CAMNT_0025803317 /DNA_START=326 /DNA_END=571 /DNA_ORIENTATION=+
MPQAVRHRTGDQQNNFSCEPAAWVLKPQGLAEHQHGKARDVHVEPAAAEEQERLQEERWPRSVASELPTTRLLILQLITAHR